ncbi:protein disulfide oxidoreductase [Mycolicibacterium vanbaalenii]|uniref:protein disulfide oxidoreductase n=1 Tax=Mycolicibacterium vanbaalenii TaxID=110539 RepID=UPI0035C72AEB
MATQLKGIMLTRSLFATLAATTILVSACGSDTGSEASPAPPTTSVAAGDHTQTSTDVPAQLQFTATTLEGQEFKGESVLGKPAVFWFWAPWCPTCQREAPMVGKLADTHPDVTFVGVAALDQLPAMQQFVDQYPVKGFSHLADTDGAVWAKFGITQQPAFAFVRADGNIDVVRGTLPEPELTERITALTNQ